jgi:Kinesin motor domain
MELDSVRIRVGVRVRPLIALERENGSNSVISCSGNHITIYDETQKLNQTYKFDWVFSPCHSQRQIFDFTCKPLIEHAFRGGNSTIFAYGQTGSGKSYTMGNVNGRILDGIILHCLKEVLSHRDRLIGFGTRVIVEYSCMELHNDECFDLLTSEYKKVEIKESKDGEVHLPDLIMRSAESLEHVVKNLVDAFALRTTGSTACNSKSSRSHAIFTMCIRVYDSKKTGSYVTGAVYI